MSISVVSSNYPGPVQNEFSSSTSGVDYFKKTDILLKKGAHTLNLSRVLAQA